MRQLFIFLTLMSMTLFADTSSALEKASKENKHLYIFFYKEKNEKTLALEEIFNKGVEKLGEEATSLKVQANDPSQRHLIDQFKLKRAPMPFVIVLAPNGAIVGGFTSFNEEQLIGSLSSKGAAECMKALQEKKMILLSLQNSQTLENEAALRGIEEFKADPRFAKRTELIVIDPSDKKEETFLKQLGVNTKCPKAITTLISPPSEIIGSYEGSVTKAQLVSDVEKANSGCCCPGGCCPQGQCR
jgi:hypothetical protein